MRSRRGGGITRPGILFKRDTCGLLTLKQVADGTFCRFGEMAQPFSLCEQASEPRGTLREIPRLREEEAGDVARRVAPGSDRVKTRVKLGPFFALVASQGKPCDSAAEAESPVPWFMGNRAQGLANFFAGITGLNFRY